VSAAFRADLLDGAAVVVAAPGGAGSAGAAIAAQLRSLGADVADLPDDILTGEDAAADWARRRAPLHALVIDAAPSFGPGGAEALRRMLNVTWRAARAVAVGALIEAAQPGRFLFLAPRPGAGPHAEAARAALENLARTLSVEWARHAITAVALTPGAATTDAELAELASFLVSPAGGYFSGCRFDLGAVPAPA
jgi:NAD(P)-dependent dehydrogenase (short-subunit alcohol dehydrogenase family)